ncbi:protein RRP5 homolog [Helicoverpa armigera]|uniref:protein RRP5 homolog n=1 Tax=Helicoverpa armigera TaxID=29058 RepID=UPI003082D632
MADNEEYFPRGGKKPTTTHFKQNANFLGAPEKGEKKRKKPKKKSEGDDGYLSDEGTKEIDQSFKNCAFGLSYKTIKEGLLVLGRVKSVLETKIIVSLPCRMIGSIMACHISEPYNKLLEAYVNDKTDKVQDLHEMFRPGQYIAVKVLEVKELSLMLSVMPQHVNGQMTHKDLQKGYLLQAAVSSVEDHGYVMDIGVPGTTAFLPKANTNSEMELEVGMVCWCSIKAGPSGGSTVVTLSNELSALQNSWLRQKTSGPLIPGSNVDFIVDTPLDNGIEGHVFGDTTAYVQRQHADSVKGKKPTLGQKIRARLLYVMPTRNTPFLTMKNVFESTFPDLEAEQQLQDGQIIEEAKVLKITGRSIHFRLGGGCYGTMSLKRIQVDEDLTDEEVVAKSYPIGSSHKVRVLCYNLSDYVYSVSDQSDVLTEKYFNFEQLKPGDIVDATVKSVADNHVLLNVGRVSGYVSQAHLSDSGLLTDTKKSSVSKLPKKKYKPGQSVKARVLVVDPTKQTLFLTLKPSLLSPDIQVLDSYEKAVVGRAYTGVIKHIKDYLLVSFFNNVVAFVPRQYVTKEPLDVISQAFHIGQIVNCTIIKVYPDAKKMTGSLTTQPFTPSEKREKPTKRKQKQDDEVPNKKTKTEQPEVKDKKKKHTEVITQESEPEETSELDNKKKKKKSKVEHIEEEEDQPVTKKDKKKKLKKESTDDNATTEDDETQVKDKKKNKKKKDKEISEESDAIETDINDDEQVLTPQDLALIDFTSCVTAKQYKKRIVSLLKSINNRSKRISRIDRKIERIEEKGLDPLTKVYHTAMHNDKLIVQERLEKLMAALAAAQEKLNELGGEFSKKDYKKEKEEKKLKREAEKGGDVVEKLEVKVADSLEPALQAPSVQDFWSAGADSLVKNVQDEEDTSSEDEETEQPKKKRKKLTVAEKLAKVREEEERVRELERRATESDTQPRSAEQFERALLASPNSSQLWIAYMAFHLQATDIDKARNVGRRALATIVFREDLEKFNTYAALMSVECRFGTKESLQKILDEALQMNDPFKIHSKLLDIYVETGKQQELVALVDLMLRKYKRETSVYGLCGAACFKLGLVDKARQVMQKAISVLEKKEHVPVLVQFALLERNSGARERAEALFEQVLAVYPARVDVASAYVDMLLKAGDKEHVRQVMERMTSQKLPARKMKVLFKKWIEVEEKIGDQEQVDRIRQRAMDYIEKAKF